jgi:hypothetical protein
MQLFKPENLFLPFSPVAIGRVQSLHYIGITRPQVATLNSWGITEDILLRKPGHILSLNPEFPGDDSKAVSHIFAFVNAANAEFLGLDQGPQMFLKSLCLEVI